MLELITVRIGKFVRNINEKKKKKINSLFKKVVHQTFWLIGCSMDVILRTTENYSFISFLIIIFIY